MAISEINPYQTYRQGGVGGYQGYNQSVNPFGGSSYTPVDRGVKPAGEEDRYVAAASANISTRDIEQASAFIENGGLLALAGVDSAASLGTSHSDFDAWAQNGGAPVNDGTGFYGGTVGTRLDVNLDKIADYYSA